MPGKRNEKGMGGYNSKVTDDTEFLSYPLLHALSVRPKSARELSRNLMISRAQVYRRLNQLAAQHLVVQRATDRKWVPICTIKIERPEDGLRNAQEGPQEPSHEVQTTNPTLAAPVEKPKSYKPPADSKASPQSMRIAKHFRVPARISKREACMGTVAVCSNCDRPTPLRYDTVSLCPICARQGHVDRSGGDSVST